MRIDEVEIRHARLPLVQPFVTSFGREDVRETVLVAVRSEGITGWGEAATSKGPWYEYETVETCWHLLNEFLAPLLAGKEVESPEDAARRMAPVRGHHIAKMGLEAAIWDLLAQRQGVSLRTLVGGDRDRVAVGVSVGIQPSIGRLLAVIAGYLEQGYGRIKIKIRPGWDVNVVRRARERFPDVLLMADANSAYTLADDAMLVALDEFGLLMVEQPLAYDDLLDHAELQRRMHTPICLDESVPGLSAARAALALGSGRIINIKPGRVGGLVTARQIHDLCRSNGIPVWCGGMLETGIGRAHNVALASLPGFTLPGDISASARYFHEDLVEPEFTLQPDGTIAVPTGPGIGVRVVRRRLDAATVRRSVVS